MLLIKTLGGDLYRMPFCTANQSKDMPIKYKWKAQKMVRSLFQIKQIPNKIWISRLESLTGPKSCTIKQSHLHHQTIWSLVTGCAQFQSHPIVLTPSITIIIQMSRVIRTLYSFAFEDHRGTVQFNSIHLTRTSSAVSAGVELLLDVASCCVAGQYQTGCPIWINTSFPVGVCSALHSTLL